jgi:glycosyltransferase involved in cell wall biosynthesis/polysaccharide pyruvyl transferase WcaK-like protein
MSSMHSPDRSLTLSPDARTLWVHWGRTGGGPRFLADLVDGDLASDDPSRSAFSYNPDAEIADRFVRVAGTGVPAFPVPTYNSTAGVILGVPRLLWNSVRLRRWIRERRIGRVVCVMESVYQSLALPLLVPRDVEYVACIHDATLHPGEENILQTLGKRNELRRADRVVTFSDAVTRALSDRVDVPVTTGSHPPFDLQDAATEPRDLPAGAVPVVGIFGRLQRYKGIDIALEAARILRRRGAPDFELRITGSGPEERLRDTDLGREAVWDNRWIPEDEVTDIVRATDIMLLPYTEASQSGPVTLALAHAVPCVATPVGAIPDQVEGFGVVADSATPEALADALESLLSDPDRYRELSASAVRRVTEQPDWSDLAELIRGDGAADGAASDQVPSSGRSTVARIKWAGQRFFGVLNSFIPVPGAEKAAGGAAGSGKVNVVLPAAHGSFGDEAMGLVAASALASRGLDVDLVVPGEAAPWFDLVPEGVGVTALDSVTLGPGNTPTARTVARLARGPLVVIGADTLAGDYELALLATRIRLLNLAAAAGYPAALVNFSLPSVVHPDARRILRRLDPAVQVRARDLLSARRAEEILGRPVPATPDIAALLDPAETSDRPGNVAFVPNAHLGRMYGVSTAQLVSLWRDVGVRLTERDPGQSVDVVVHDIRDSVGDAELGQRIVDALEDSGVRASLVVPTTAAGAKAVLSRACACVSARMHAGVASLSSGVPTVGIGYVGKFSGQFAWYGALGAVAEYRPDLTADDILAELDRVLDAEVVADRDSAVRLIRDDYSAMTGSGPDRT